MKRKYSASIPSEVYQEIDKVARKNGLTPGDMLQKFVKLGLLIAGGLRIYYKNDDGEETEIEL